MQCDRVVIASNAMIGEQRNYLRSAPGANSQRFVVLNVWTAGVGGGDSGGGCGWKERRKGEGRSRMCGWRR